MTPTARSLGELRRLGYTAAVVERWNPWAKCRQDLYGFLDILAIKSGEPGVMGIQTTTGDHVADRMRKAKESANLSVWLASGNHFQVWGWVKRGRRGKRKVWTLDRQQVGGVGE